MKIPRLLSEYDGAHNVKIIKRKEKKTNKQGQEPFTTIIYRQ